MSKPCSNTSTGCTGFAVRGNILCETCLEAKKAQSKNRRDIEMDMLTTKIRDLEQSLLSQKQQYEKKLEEKLCTLHLEKDSVRQGELVKKIREENQRLVDEKSRYEMTYKQTLLDNEKLLLDLSRMATELTSLKEQNKALEEENKNFSQILAMSPTNMSPTSKSPTSKSPLPIKKR